MGGSPKIGPDLNFFANKNYEPDVFIAYCPERVLPGNILQELQENDRVIGGLCHKSSDLAISFYSKFVTGNFYRMTSKTAEMSKLVENNSYRDVNIAFTVELAALSKDLDINVWNLIELANKHPRVNVLYPGAGVGGIVLLLILWFIVSQNPQKSALIKQARLINNHKPLSIVQDVIKSYSAKRDGILDKDYKIGLLGYLTNQTLMI